MIGALPPESEKYLQAEIVQWLSLAAPDALVYEFGRPGGRPVCPRCGATVGRLSGALPVGWPDVLVILPGPVYVHLEVKTTRGTVTPAQSTLSAELLGMGCWVAVVRSVDAVADVLRQAGYEPRIGMGV